MAVVITNTKCRTCPVQYSARGNLAEHKDALTQPRMLIPFDEQTNITDTDGSRGWVSTRLVEGDMCYHEDTTLFQYLLFWSNNQSTIVPRLRTSTLVNDPVLD